MNWLLLRGLIREQRHWGPFPELLKASNPGTNTFCLDFPGFGTERARTSPTTISGIADDVRLRWEKLKDQNPGDWGIIANSLGGMLAIDWCVRHPSDFRRLVVVNSSLKSLSPFWDRLHARNWLRMLQTNVSSDPAVRERNILEMTMTDKDCIEESFPRNVKIATDSPVRRGDFFRQIFAASRYAPQGKPVMPVLVVAGAGDRLVEPSCSRAIAEEFGAPLRMHPTAGHDLTVEDPAWVIREINAWSASI